MVRENGDGYGQTSIDFLVGMTLFMLTLIFALNFMSGMVEPYTSTSGESIEVADRASDKLYTDTLSSPNQRPGYFNYSSVSEFFENSSEPDIRDALGLSETQNFNITVSSDYTSYGPRDGLIAYWSLNERRSEEATDIAGPVSTRLNGGVEGNITTDMRGISSSGAYKFNDAEAAINVTNDPSLNPADTGNLTISAWVKPRQTQPDYATIAAKGLDSGYQMHLESDGATRNPVFEGGDTSNPPEAQWNNPLDAGEWHHLVGVYQNHSSDPDHEYLKLYVNGDLKVTNWENGSNKAIAAAPGDNFGIGNNLQTSDRHFNGIIDEVRLYDRALSESEVKDMYESAGVLSPDKPDTGSSINPIVNTTYTVGDEIPSGQDIASVSSRTRVGYIGRYGQTGDDTVTRNRDGGDNSQRLEFTVDSSVDGEKLSIINVTYPPSSVNVTPLIMACANSENARDGIQPPCPGLIDVGIDSDGDGTVDEDLSDYVRCRSDDCVTPNPGAGDGLMIADGIFRDEHGLRLELETPAHAPDLEESDTVIFEYPLGDPDANTACGDSDARIESGRNTVIERSLNVCGDSGTSDSSPDIGTAEVSVKVW